jgi:hypothetical protein
MACVSRRCSAAKGETAQVGARRAGIEAHASFRQPSRGFMTALLNIGLWAGSEQVARHRQEADPVAASAWTGTFVSSVTGLAQLPDAKQRRTVANHSGPESPRMRVVLSTAR